MTKKRSTDERPYEGFKNNAARQRWELFHRAIAEAKKSNSDALQEADRREQPASLGGEDADKSGPAAR